MHRLPNIRSLVSLTELTPPVRDPSLGVRVPEGGGGVKGLGHEMSVLYCIQGTGKVGGGGVIEI